MLSSLPPPGAAALIYGHRLSPSHSDRSHEDRLASCRSLAKRHGWAVAGEHFDETPDGGGCPNLSRAVRSAMEGEIQVIIADDIGDLLRVRRSWMYAQCLRDAGVVVVTSNGKVVDSLELLIRAVMAQEHAEAHGRRVKQGLLRRRQMLEAH